METRGNGSEVPSAGGDPALSRSVDLDFQDPEVVLSVLEADQVVAAKQQMRFGQRKLSFGTRLLFWALRVYVVVMLVIVLLSVLRALR